MAHSASQGDRPLQPFTHVPALVTDVHSSSTSVSVTPAPLYQPPHLINLTVLGAGAWGSALTGLARFNGCPVQAWSRHGELTLGAAIDRCDVLLSAISMGGVPETVRKIQALGLSPHTVIVSATKGLDAATLQTPSHIWHDAFPQNPIVVLSGPNLAKEIEDGLPGATVVASVQATAAQRVRDVFASDRFRVYTNADPLGTELGGTLKNVIAIAVGVCDGLKLGTNAKSALITRALPEVVRIGTHLGGQRDTFYGLSGLGDMLATCSSALSRNYQVGYGLAQGKTLHQVMENLQGTAEGVNTTNVLMRLAEREQISVPISAQVYRLLNGLVTPQDGVVALMDRELKPEWWADEAKD
ncbi:NAD(P)H-dependent glycerol-3-phosphate dehydrogenase [Prochlorothrix hollandica]|uniref:NAD(P)H-dependent glycerol-3-phosphate dehydrogenase n=1 Tax=Prochlorothrix hollandica TaxID=1223 RepID=UPI00034512DF|nr:NAD(P)H-dependent glycerol-3-phosphate dehydrogenase [Prochlorothrix hollandica]